MAHSAVRASCADAVAGRAVLFEAPAVRGSICGDAVWEAGRVGKSECGECDGDGGVRVDVFADRDALRDGVFRWRGVYEGRSEGRSAW